MDEIPVLRGVTHFWAVWFAAAGALVLVLFAASATARVAATIYGLGLIALFAGSATYHRWRWDPRWRPLLRRVDHSTIFVFIAASFTPVGILVLDGALATIVLVVVWAGALLGVFFSLVWIDAPRWLQAALYVGLGWVGVAATPQMLDRLGTAPVVLFGVGGVLYTVGAVVYALRRPDPWPLTFGFHEIFHAFVIGAAVCHFVAMAGWVVL
ncbi:MAG: hemolysin [Solirubrobacteraceae bacterium]|nr:hemolysin [Solirubrobacteraceae bacterium]